MKTSVETVDESRVKLHVEIPADDFEREVAQAFRKLAADVKIPGFRPGKAPRRLLEQRLGPGAARREALRDALPRYYAEAVQAEGVDAIAAPEISIIEGAEAGGVTFEAVVEVRPKVRIDGYRGMRVVLPRPEPSAEEIRAQVDHLREKFADLETSSAPLSDGDYALIDLRGYQGGELVEGLSATDFLYEVGSGQLVPELDEQLRGKRPGEILTFSVHLPSHFGERAGRRVEFRVLVKEAKRKVLPPLTDEWVQEASEFETVAELEEDVRRRLELVRKVHLQVALRDKLLDQLADLVTTPLPETLVEEETRRRVEDVGRQIESRGGNFEQYLQATNQSPEGFLARVRESAARAVKADLALRAIVEQEGIEVTEDEVEEQVGRIAARMGQEPARVRAELERGGGLETVRSEVARGKALQLLVDHATVVDDSGRAVDLSVAERPDDRGTGEPGPPEDREGLTVSE